MPPRRKLRRKKTATSSSTSAQTTFTAFRTRPGHVLWRYSRTNIFQMTSSDFDPSFLKQVAANTTANDSDIEEYDPSQALGLEQTVSVDIHPCPPTSPQKRPASPERAIQHASPPPPKKQRTRAPRKQVLKPRESLVSLTDVIQFYIPTLILSQFSLVRKVVNEMIRGTGSPYADNQDLFDASQLIKSQPSLMEALTNIVSVWRMCLSTKCPLESSLQDSSLTIPTGAWSSQHIESQHARTLGKFFECLLTTAEQPASHSLTEKTHFSQPVSTVVRDGITSTCSTPVFGTDTLAAADVSSPSNTFAYPPSATPVQSNPFLPKTSNALRSITWQMGNTNCTARWAQNKGEYLVKMEVYRWSEVQQLPSREWWRHAVHRSQVFGDAGEQHIQLAMQRDKALQALWVDPEKNWQPRHHQVETFGEQRQTPKCSFPSSGPGQPWQHGSYW